MKEFEEVKQIAVTSQTYNASKEFNKEGDSSLLELMRERQQFKNCLAFVAFSKRNVHHLYTSGLDPEADCAKNSKTMQAEFDLAVKALAGVIDNANKKYNTLVSGDSTTKPPTLSCFKKVEKEINDEKA